MPGQSLYLNLPKRKNVNSYKIKFWIKINKAKLKSKISFLIINLMRSTNSNQLVLKIVNFLVNRAAGEIKFK